MSRRSIGIAVLADLDPGVGNEDVKAVIEENLRDMADRYDVGIDMMIVTVSEPPPSEEGINEAHAEGRHASTHPADIKAWAGLGCVECQSRTTGDQKQGMSLLDLFRSKTRG